MYYLEIQGLFKALCKFKDFSRQAVKFKSFSILYEPGSTSTSTSTFI